MKDNTIQNMNRTTNTTKEYAGDGLRLLLVLPILAIWFVLFILVCLLGIPILVIGGDKAGKILDGFMGVLRS